MNRRRRMAVGSLSVAAHVGLIAALLSVAPSPVRIAEPDVVPVEIAPRYLPLQPPKPSAEEAAPAEAPSLPAAPPKLKARKPVPPPPAVRTISVAPSLTPAKQPSPVFDTLSDAEVASAAHAGSGGGGGSGEGGGRCDMAARLEAKLRGDPKVRAAMAGAPVGRAVRLWNGSWVRHGEQEGAGLAAVREAIMWEVAWAPEACRREPVRGLVVLTVADGPPASRVAVGVGAAAWRWSDLLFAKGAVRASG